METALQAPASDQVETSTATAATTETSGSAKSAATSQESQNKRKVKVNGREEEVDIDTLVKDYQKYRAGDERLRAAAEREKLQAKWLEDIKADPWKVFEELKLDADTLAEKRLLKKLEYEMMSPDAKTAYEAKKEAEALKRDKEAAEARAKELEEKYTQNEFQTLQSKYAEELDSAIPEYFKSTGKTATPEAIAAAIEYMIAHVETHGEITDIKKALEHADQRHTTTVKNHVQKLPIKELVEILSDAQLDGIRGYHLDRVREQNPLRKSKESAPSQPRVTKQMRVKTDDFFKNLENRWR